MDINEFFLVALFLFSVIGCVAALCYTSWRWIIIAFSAFALAIGIGTDDFKRDCYCDICGIITNYKHQVRKTSNESVFLCETCYKEKKQNAVSE